MNVDYIASKRAGISFIFANYGFGKIRQTTNLKLKLLEI